MKDLRIKLDLELYDAQCIVTALLKAGIGYSRLVQQIEAKIAEDTAEHYREKAEADAAARRDATHRRPKVFRLIRTAIDAAVKAATAKAAGGAA